jgi:hypothetical protein
MGEMSKEHKSLAGRPKWKIPIRKLNSTWVDNIKMYLKETGFEGRDWTHLAQVWTFFPVLVTMEMKIRVS